MKASTFDRHIRIERPVADDSFDGAGSGEWVLFDEVYAQVQDVLPSRSERMSMGFNMSARPARVRMWFIEGVTPNMRFVMDGRVMQIVSGPAEIGRREGLEFMVEEYSPAGNAA